MTSVDPSTSSRRSSSHRELAPLPRHVTDRRPVTGPVQVPAPRTPGAQISIPRVGTVLARVRAWMVVLPADAVLLAAPLLWAPQQWRAHVTMTMLGLLMLTGGNRYRARLHLSVLDELPVLLGRLLTAAAVIATVIALRHEQDSVTTFLVNVLSAISLVIAGRIGTTWLVGLGRRRRVTRHSTVIIGGGALAAELAGILQRHPGYGLAVAGFVDDGDNCVAAAVVPQLGGLGDLDREIGGHGADVLLIADGDFAERKLLDIVRTPAARRCDLLMVPRMHHFAMQTGLGDHIGSIPVYRVRTPNLRGPAHMVKRAFDVVLSGLALVVTAPLMSLCALAVRDRGRSGRHFPAAACRTGRGGVPVPEVAVDVPSQRD